MICARRMAGRPSLRLFKAGKGVDRGIVLINFDTRIEVSHQNVVHVDI